MKRSIRTLLSIALVLPLLHACGGNSEEDQGAVRLINATTDFTSLDAYRDDLGLVNSVTAGSSSGYANLDKDSYTFKIAQSGSGSTAATLSGSVSAGSHYALLAYASGSSLQVSYLTEDESAPSSGYAKLRFMHTAGVEAGNVDVYVGHTACSALGSTDIAAASALSTSTGSPSLTSYASYGAGSYHVCVTSAGSKTDLRLDIPALSLSDQQILTVVLTRSSGGVLVHGVLVNQQGPVSLQSNLSSRVRVVANPLSGTINVAVNGTTVGSNFAPGAIGSYRLVTAGTLAVTVNGSSVGVGTSTAPSGADLTLLVTGDVASPKLSVITDDNTPSTSTSEPVKLRVVNGVNGLSTNVTFTLDSDVVGDDVAFGTASLSATVPASAALAAIAASSGATTLWQVKDQTLTTGKVYTAFLLGDTTTVGTASQLRADR